jgi:hypothetical protein
VNLSLAGELIETIKVKAHGKKAKDHRKNPTKTISLAPVGTTAPAGTAITVMVRLPKAALSALGAGVPESASFTLIATDANGTSTATARIDRLGPRR